MILYNKYSCVYSIIFCTLKYCDCCRVTQ